MGWRGLTGRLWGVWFEGGRFDDECWWRIVCVGVVLWKARMRSKNIAYMEQNGLVVRLEECCG